VSRGSGNWVRTRASQAAHLPGFHRGRQHENSDLTAIVCSVMLQASICVEQLAMFAIKQAT
jgi:hypothetical protein